MKEIDKNELELLRKKAESNVKEVISNKKRRTVNNESNNISSSDKVKDEVVKIESNAPVKNYNFKIDSDENYSNNKEELNENKNIRNKKGIKKEKVKNKKEKVKNKKEKVKKKKEKEPFNGKKFLLKLFICIVIATFLTIIAFYFLDRFMYNISNTNLLKQKPVTGLQSKGVVNTGITVTDSMQSIQYSYNNKYYTYLSEGKVYIKEINDNSDVATITAENEICYYHLLYDKNLVYYITKKDSQYSTYLQIYTYDISSGKTSEFNEFTVSGFVRIKDMEYSPLVNIIYLNVERKSGAYTENIVYRLDLFNNMSRYASNMIVNKMCMLKQEEALYFEDGEGINYYKGYVLRIFKESTDLIGVDLNDKVYFISADRTKIYVVKNRTILNTIQLEDTNMVTWYSDNTNVYLIYPNYVINISSDNPLEKVGKMSEYMTFQCIKGNKMYLLTKDNRIISTDINVKK